MKQEMIGWQWHQLGYMQIISTFLQTDSHASMSSLSFYRLDALYSAQPTCQSTEGNIEVYEHTLIK